MTTSDYTNYNDSANVANAPVISNSGRKIIVTKPGQTGDVVVLFVDKSGNGAVEYQATATFDSNGVASINVPVGVNITRYNVATLFLDGEARGGEYAENVVGSYVREGLILPCDVTYEYNGYQHTSAFADLQNEYWWADEFNDSSMVNVQINQHSDLHHNGDKMIVTFTINNTDLQWIDKTTGRKEMTISIVAKPVGLIWSQDSKGRYSVVANPNDICLADQANAADVVVTRYTNMIGTPSYNSTDPPNNVGDYTASAELDNTDYYIKPGETLSKDFNLPIQKIPILGAVNFDPSNSQEYNSKNRVFLIVNYPDYRVKGDAKDAAVEISVPDRFTGKISIFGDTITVLDGGKVGTYALLLTLTDPANSQWADKEDNALDRNALREIEFSITPKPFELIISGGLTNGALTVTEENDAIITLEIADRHPFGNDEISLDVYAVRAGATTEYPLATDIIIKAEDNDFNIFTYDVELKTSTLPLAGKYTIKVVIRDKADTANANYEIDMDDVELTIVEATDEGNLVWRLSAGGSSVASIRTAIGVTETQYNPASPLVFGIDKTYTFIVTTPSGYSVDTTYNIDDFKNGYKNTSQSNANADGEYYTSYVRIIDLSSGNGETYSITWRIERAVFNLAPVIWKDNGKLEYNGYMQSPSLENVPKGLEVALFGAVTEESRVDVYGEVRVQFRVESAYRGNFVEPVEDDSNSYDGDFAWRLPSWEITKAKIILVWEYKQAEGVEVPFNVLVLRVDSNISRIIDYLYYETDALGNIKDINNPLRENEIELLATERKYFKALPILQTGYEGNYEFEKDEPYSDVFSVGGGATQITVTLLTVEYQYTGKDVSLKWASGTPTGSLKFTYYVGDTAGVSPVSGTPKDAGTYTVVVESNNSSIVLDPNSTQFTFKITPSVIS
ncbi:MAG: hypothetical protein HDT29_05445, partial [Clostridiales bacterium]|nr:hypothetical protein [Clostridiales bacterium]